MNLQINKKVIKESDVKKKVKEIIEAYAPNTSVFMPVVNGMGRAHLDFICSVYGCYLAIETKVVGKRPTLRQQRMIEELVDSGALVLIIDELNLENLQEVLIYLQTLGVSAAKYWAEVFRDSYYLRAEEGNYRA